MKLCEFEKTEILPWHRGYNELPVDLTNPVEVCKWCADMHKYRAEPNATSVIDRWNIGLYQMTYIDALLMNFEPREFGEAIGSVFIHMVGAFEYCGVDCADRMNLNLESQFGDCRENYELILEKIPSITRQIYYFGKNRKNRVNKEELDYKAKLIIDALINMNNKYNSHLPMSDSLMLAMAKVQEREFRTHG